MRLILFCIFFVLLIASVNAADEILVRSEPDLQIATPIESTTFKVYVTNNQDHPDTFEFKYFDINWRVDATPIRLNSKQVGSTTVRITPLGEKEPRKYGVPINVVSQSNPALTTKHDLVIEVVDYSKLLTLNFEPVIPEIDPRKSAVIRLKVKNEQNIRLENLKITLQSEFFKKERTITLDKNEVKTEDFLVDLPKDTREGEYALQTLITYGTKDIVKKESIIRITHYTSIKKQESEERGFLIKRISVVKINEGNAVMHDFYTYEIRGNDKLFTSSSPEPDSITRTEKGYLLRWEYDLNPGEKLNIEIKINYRNFFFTVIFILVIGSITYYIFKREIRLQKRIVTIRHEKEGISTLKVVLNLKNKSLKTIKNVKLLDRSIRISEPPHSFGTLKPDKIRKTEDGFEMMWNIPHLAGGEERIISYKVNSKLQLIGKVPIPIAYIKYMKNGRPFVVRSNKVRLFS